MTINLSDEMIANLLKAVKAAKRTEPINSDNWNKYDEAESMLTEMRAA